MAFAGLSVRVHSRSKGHSAAAAVAYRTGARIRDPYSGREHDYTSRTARDEVLGSDVVGPGSHLFGDTNSARAAAFAIAVDQAEKRRNSSIGRDMIVPLPHELTLDEQRDLLLQIALQIAQRYHTPVQWSHHRPCREGDDRNGHGHVLVPTRRFEIASSRFGKKLRVLDDHTTGRGEIRVLRELVETGTNRALERAGIPDRVSLQRRADGLAQPKLGQACTALEREGARAAGHKVENMAMSDLVTQPGYEPVTERGRRLREHVETAWERAERDIELEYRRTRERGYRTPVVKEPAVQPTPANTRSRRLGRAPRPPRTPRLPRPPRPPRPKKIKGHERESKPGPADLQVKPCPAPPAPTPVRKISRPAAAPATEAIALPPTGVHPVGITPSRVDSVVRPAVTKIQPPPAIGAPPVTITPCPDIAVTPAAVAGIEPPPAIIIPPATPVRERTTPILQPPVVPIVPPPAILPPTQITTCRQREPWPARTARTPAAPQMPLLAGTRAYGTRVSRFDEIALFGTRELYPNIDWKGVRQVAAETQQTTEMAYEMIERMQETSHALGQESEITMISKAESILGVIEDTIEDIIEQVHLMWEAIRADRVDTDRWRKNQGAGGGNQGQSGLERERWVPGTGAGTPTRPGKPGTDWRPRPIERPRRE